MRELVSSGVETWAVARFTSAHRRRVEAAEGAQAVLVRSWELDELERAVGDRTFDAVYNALGSGTSHAERDWESLFDGNVRAAFAVARLAAKRSSRLVHLGTCSEYAPKPPEAGPLTESDPVLPTSAYGATKAAARPLLQQVCHGGGIDYVHARLFNTYGPFEGENRIVPYVARRIEAGEPAELTEGSQVRDFTFVGDVCGALALLGTCALPHELPIFNVSSGVPMAVRELALAVAERLGAPRALLRFGARPQRGDEPSYL
ncbi:MAG: NAD-dependent epimerase/dehydratase family protein, partial [Candidatus Binatia bacterium]